MDPGSLALAGWREFGIVGQRVPFTMANTTVNGALHDAAVWDALRWGEEHSDGQPNEGCGLYLHVSAALFDDRLHEVERVVYRVRSLREVGDRALLVDGKTTARAVVSGVRLARDPRGLGGWAWLLSFRPTKPPNTKGL
jgi:hypothetical protein